jgi:hypothetical protein
MSGLILFLKSKVVLAVLGAVLFGTAGALVAAVPFGSTPPGSSSSAPQGQAGLAALDDATATPGGATSSSTSTPTQSPTKAPTKTSTPKPTNTPGTGAVTLRGTIQSVNTSANTFTIKLFSGAITTVGVTANTVFQGRATSLSGLQVGWSVSVTGTYQTDGTFAATTVNAYDD